MKCLLRLIAILFVICFSIDTNAQSAGDRLFKQGQELQMKQNERSQNQAIAKFAAAKKAYDSTEKKAMCDNQIKICKSNLITIRKNAAIKKNNTLAKKTVEPVVKEEKVESEPEPQMDPVKLSLSVSTIEFKSSGKKGDNHQVTVNCNYDNWTYECPEWINVTKNGNILTLTASTNETGEERSSVFVVECNGTKAELMVYQKAKFSLKSIIGNKKKKK